MAYFGLKTDEGFFFNSERQTTTANFEKYPTHPTPTPGGYSPPKISVSCSITIKCLEKFSSGTHQPMKVEKIDPNST